jgi:hypothetical protein
LPAAVRKRKADTINWAPSRKILTDAGRVALIYGKVISLAESPLFLPE